MSEDTSYTEFSIGKAIEHKLPTVIPLFLNEKSV